MELAARASYVDLDSQEIAGGRELNASIGVNWYLLMHLALQANYILAWFPESRGVANIVQLRLQLDY